MTHELIFIAMTALLAGAIIALLLKQGEVEELDLKVQQLRADKAFLVSINRRHKAQIERLLKDD